MIYLVSRQDELFNQDDLYQKLSVEDSVKMISSWSTVQFDSETSGRDPHLCDILCVQFGNREADIQIVVDTTTVDILSYKTLLETKFLIGHNLKFDIQFLYKFKIIPRKCWDTMIVEQLLHLGYDVRYFRYSLKDVALRRLNVDIDKTTRGEIIWRGLDPAVIKYAAGDVVYLEDIYKQQLSECSEKTCINAAKLENAFVPVIAYLEWCGIKLDVTKWEHKMQLDEESMNKSLKELNQWLLDESVTKEPLRKFTSYDPMNMFNDQFDPVVTINWNSPSQVMELVHLLGFNTKVDDKITGGKKDSIVEGVLSKQKGICDDFIKHYFDYKGAQKVCSTYGKVYIDAINPVTGRIHTQFKQLGASSGRMSCGGGIMSKNTDLAKYKHISPDRCCYVQIQNLPADEPTRSSFVCEPGNLMCSCDYSALESRLGADIYNEPAMIEEYLHGSGDIHSLTAKACFPKDLANIEVKDIKALRPDLRKKAKPVEFSQQFGGSAKAISNSLGCSMQEAKEIAAAYNDGFKGIAAFKAKGSAFVRTHGYIVICKYTGHKIYWQDFKKWRAIEDLPEYVRIREYSLTELAEHNMAASKWDRLALNSPTQGTGIACLKLAMSLYFKWILENNYFGTVLLCDLVHDEAVVEAPKEIADTAFSKLKECMENATAALCKKLPIPAEAEIGYHWIH